MTHIFIYGTLKKDEKYNYLLKGDKTSFLGTGKTFNLMSMVKHPEHQFPCLFEKENHHISGEIYLIPDSILKDLDKFEEVPTLYKRKEIPIIFKSKIIQCQAYIFNEKIDGELLTDWFTL